MICYCTSCHYTFKADDLPEFCPDCGKPAVRPATEKEKADYIKIQEELKKEKE